MSFETVSIRSPFKYGMNVLQGVNDDGMEFARSLSNLIYDENGALALAPPWRDRGHTFDTTEDIHFAFSFPSLSFTAITVVASAGTDADTEMEGTTNTPLGLGYDWFDGALSFGSNSSPDRPVDAGHWKGVHFNGEGYLFQRGSPAKTVSNTGVIADNTDAPEAGVAHFAFGHMFTGLGPDLAWSDFRDPLTWDTGSAGEQDLSTLGITDITAIADFNNRLVVFSRDRILFFDFGAVDLGSLAPVFTAATLVDSIEGIGCVAQQSVVSTGTDLIFLSAQGVRSVGRLTQSDGVLPVGQVSTLVDPAIVDDMLAVADTTSMESIKGLWWPEKRWYLLSFPARSKVWVFDFTMRTPVGTPRVTTLPYDVRSWIIYPNGVTNHVGALVYDITDGYQIAAIGGNAGGGTVWPDAGRPTAEAISLPTAFGAPDRKKFMKEVELAGFGEEASPFGGTVSLYALDEGPEPWTGTYVVEQAARSAIDADLRWHANVPVGGDGTELQTRITFNGGTLTDSYSLTRLAFKLKLGRRDSGRF